MTHGKVKRTVHVSIRPGTHHLLKTLSPHFDIVVFTASDRKMTEHLVDFIDPGRHIQCRLYRDSCSISHETGHVTKDLSLMGRPLQHVVLLDDNPLVCSSHHVDNLWRCSEYTGDKKDRELFAIAGKLLKWHAVEVRLNTSSRSS
ncbi:hypothetical protein H257_00256 [Aphanomyces astaci]|uniref:Mitochondrial import inner membrane translocase subunit TIM50 n=1 Tax=Aphanomyces astaci TaxID=112090 RepID=W4H9Z0_APHAT|nr:hypothetical protein H257_00256 [Aphanomyces astaci]ETV88742.1 hypothetical protein H257_00256 [Aphanomyces astaci]|eukprot:XP_009821142.1 hypothetical protein H257_00256 [Aphanomyces astaci]